MTGQGTIDVGSIAPVAPREDPRAVPQAFLLSANGVLLRRAVAAASREAELVRRLR